MSQKETTAQRVERFEGYVGESVRVTLTGDIYGPRILWGTVFALALRVRGAQDWIGNSYDMVLVCRDLEVRTFALSRIATIEIEGHPPDAFRPQRARP